MSSTRTMRAPVCRAYSKKKSLNTIKCAPVYSSLDIELLVDMATVTKTTVLSIISMKKRD